LWCIFKSFYNSNDDVVSQEFGAIFNSFLQNKKGSIPIVKNKLLHKYVNIKTLRNNGKIAINCGAFLKVFITAMMT
jgi:hypothetical protein